MIPGQLRVAAGRRPFGQRTGIGYHPAMTDFHELARQGVALEDRMNTKPAEYRTDIAPAGRADGAARQGQFALDDWLVGRGDHHSGDLGPLASLTQTATIPPFA